MPKVISIYDAKTNLSKLVKQAEAGETIYIGAYGKLQAILAPAPAKQKYNNRHPHASLVAIRRRKVDAYSKSSS